MYLGSIIGPDHINDSFVEGKIESWSAELEVLTTMAIANTQPLFCAFIDGIVDKWWHPFRTTGQVEVNIQPLDRSSLDATSPVTLACPPISDNKQGVLSLPTRIGGLDICNPNEFAL